MRPFPRPEGTPYEAWQPRHARLYFGAFRPYATYALLGLTGVIFVLQQATELLWGQDLLARWLMKPSAAYLVYTNEWWRLWTPVLVHGGLLHFGFNMYALYLYGPLLERLLGWRWFLALYLTAGLWGNALSASLSRYYALGASSAIFGIFAALWLLMRQHQELMGLWGAHIQRTMWALIAFNLVFGFVQPGIDNWGHIGGALGGLAFVWLAGPRWDLEPYPFERLSQHERAGFFLHRVMPLRLTDRRSWAHRMAGLALLWVLPLILVMGVGQVQLRALRA